MSPLRVSDLPPGVAKRLGVTGAKPHKFGATRTTVDGIKFDSLREANRWMALQREYRFGMITGLQRQFRYELHTTDPYGAEQLIGHCVVDFRYWRVGRLVVEDVKGRGKRAPSKTPLYQWKKRHLFIEYGIQIQEV